MSNMLIDVINKKYENLLKEFLVVYRIPEVVFDYHKNKDFNRVQDLQTKIIYSIDDDILNHVKSAKKQN